MKQLKNKQILALFEWGLKLGPLAYETVTETTLQLKKKKLKFICSVHFSFLIIGNRSHSDNFYKIILASLQQYKFDFLTPQNLRVPFLLSAMQIKDLPKGFAGFNNEMPPVFLLIPNNSVIPLLSVS